jgi:hypothetical protein
MIAATLKIIIGLGALVAARPIERGRAGIREAPFVAAASSLLMHRALVRRLVRFFARSATSSAVTN